MSSLHILHARDHTCRGCGCTDRFACDGGCSWVLIDIESCTGVCSRCAQQLRWHPALLNTVGTPSFEEALACVS